jgi:hypothetical protein
LRDDLKTLDRETMQLAHVSMGSHPDTSMKSEQAHYLLPYSSERVEGAFSEVR